MNTLRTVGKYTAGLVAGAAIADYGYESYLHSRALKCMQENQLAIQYSADPDFSRYNDRRFNHNFTVIKVSSQKSEVVGAVCVQSRRHVDEFGYMLSDVIDLWKNDVNTQVLDNGLVDISPIGHYLCHKISFGSHKQKLDRIANAVKKLPFMGYTDNANRFDEWKKSSTVIKRQ